MSQHYKQMQHGKRDARHQLNERLTREEIGDAAYDKAVSYNDYRAFKIFGFVFMVGFAVAVLAVTWLGY
jgi:hypothetical protein